ncbi:serine hydrolase domain-containing protein [Acidicapsa dinghuensis]|uniref:Serine hydrolase domain-containing protein n=1 Tax=Acidicapsa dinghuensis TaxID=2218256 RepID=A0ABW1EES6_9BACT|nr:serine hydrolase domain-containing protein [Acidicapsa dinghuensis]
MLRRAFLLVAFCFGPCLMAQTTPDGAAIDAKVGGVMAQTGAKGMAVAVIDHGKVAYVHAYGVRNAKGDPLQTDTVMYGASLTKTVFAYTVMRLVDEGKIKLDTPIADDLDKPLPSYGPDPAYPDKYGPYKDLADDPRWKKITPRMCLTHSTGFSNFYFLEPEQKLRIHFDPGTRFSYSGEGMILLQFVIEHGRKDQGLGLDVGDLTHANFARLGMTRTSLTWQEGKDSNEADGWNDKGEPQSHSKRSKVRVAGSMNTTISDMSKFTAALVRGDGLTPASRAEMTKPSLHIPTAHQFPLFQPDLPVSEQRKDLAAGLGVVVFDGPQGHGYYKGGHDGQTANTMVCVEKSQRCALILSNDVRSEAGFADLVRFILGDAGVPYDWEYGDYAGKS